MFIAALAWLRFIMLTANLVLFFSLALTLLVVPVLARLAPKIGLVDQPHGRKQHVGIIPVIGGLSIFTAVCTVNWVFNSSYDIFTILGLCSMMLLVGVLDDISDLSTLLRLLLQIAIAGLMVRFAGVEIHTVGNLLGFGDVAVPTLFTGIFTIICVVGVFNAINMIDGVDGLAGTTIALSFSSVVLFCYWGASVDMLLLAVSIVGALLGFLYFNSRVFRPQGIVFMGDAGSMSFGLLLVWFLVRLSQGQEAPLSPVAAGWIFGFPLADTVSVMVGRLRRGASPFKAGRDHFHHRMLESGYQPNEVLTIVCLIQAAMIMIGIICSIHRELEPILFWAFVAFVIMHHFVLPSWLIQRRSSANR